MRLTRAQNVLRWHEMSKIVLVSGGSIRAYVCHFRVMLKRWLICLYHSEILRNLMTVTTVHCAVTLILVVSVPVQNRKWIITPLMHKLLTSRMFETIVYSTIITLPCKTKPTTWIRWWKMSIGLLNAYDLHLQDYLLSVSFVIVYYTQNC